MDISFLVNDSFSTIDTSVMIHDYCGSIDPTHISTLRNQKTQYDNNLINTSSQTDSFVENLYTACPISDAEGNTSLPSLVIEDLSSEEATFSTGLPNKETFYLLFEHIMSNRKISNPEIGGRPRKLRDVDEFVMVLMRLRLGLLT